MDNLKKKATKFALKKAYENKGTIIKFLYKNKWARDIAFKAAKNALLKKK